MTDKFEVGDRCSIKEFHGGGYYAIGVVTECHSCADGYESYDVRVDHYKLGNGKWVSDLDRSEDERYTFFGFTGDLLEHESALIKLARCAEKE